MELTIDTSYVKPPKSKLGQVHVNNDPTCRFRLSIQAPAGMWPAIGAVDRPFLFLLEMMQ